VRYLHPWNTGFRILSLGALHVARLKQRFEIVSIIVPENNFLRARSFDPFDH
jgi:hypothetical protein